MLRASLFFDYLCIRISRRRLCTDDYPMTMVLKENAGIPAHLLWTLAVIAGVSVANLYYNQPLLDLMRLDFGVSEFQANLIAMITQVGYALGLLFIIPLGDLYHRKRIIEINFFVLVLSLLAIAVATDIRIVWGASLLTGICSVVPQIFSKFPILG